MPEHDDQLEPMENEDQRYKREMQDKYRALFTNQMGREVLADILMTCHFGGSLDPDNKAQIAEYNVGVVIAAKAGFLDQLQTILGMRPQAA